MVSSGRMGNSHTSSSTSCEVRIGWLCPDSRLATPYYVVTASRPGPTVFILGGVHGNEPAGTRAAAQIRFWPLNKGTMVVIPRASNLALQARSRWTPNTPQDEKDLNRNYPVTVSQVPRGELATDIWKLLQYYRPDYMLDMHESWDFYYKDVEAGLSPVRAEEVPDDLEPPSLSSNGEFKAEVGDDPNRGKIAKDKERIGSTICTSGGQTMKMAFVMIEAVNKTISNFKKRFQHFTGPHKKGLVYAAHAAGEY